MRIRRILRVLVVTAGIVVVLLVAAMALLHTQFAKRLALEKVQTFLTSQDISIDAADFNYSFMPLRVSTGRISIRKISEPNLPQIFSADHFAASVRINDLIHGRYRIEDLQVDHPSIRIVIDERNRSNIPAGSDKPAASNQPTDLLIVKLRSSGGSLTFEDRPNNIFVSSPLWDLTVDSNGVNDTEEFQFKTRETSEARYNGKPLAIDRIEVLGSLKQGNSLLDLHRVNISSGLGDLTLSGTVTQFNDPQLKLSMTGNVHLEPVRQFLSITQHVHGDLNLETAITGRVKELQITGHFRGREIEVDRFRDIALDADLAVDLEKNRARLKSIRARSPNLSANGAADVAFTASAGESRIDAQLDVADLQRLLKLSDVPVFVASRASGNAQLRWPGVDTGRMSGNGRIRLSARPARNGQDIPVDGIVMLQARSDRLMASIDNLDSGALHLYGQINLQAQKQIGGMLRLEVSDTGQALPQLAGWFGGSIPAELRLSGPAVLDANLAGTLQYPRIGASVEAKGLRLNGLDGIHLDAVAEYTPQQIDVPRISVQWEMETVTGSGRVGLTAATPTIDGQFAVSNASIHRVLTALGKPDIQATGIAGVAATISGTIQNPIVAATISASDLQAYGEELGTLSTEARLENQVVLLDRLTLHKAGGGELQAFGRYEIGPKAFTVDLSGSDLQVNRLLLPQGPVIHGILDLNGQARGTLADPGAVIKLSARDVRVDSENFRDVDLSINLADHRAQITGAAPYYGVQANASLGIVRPYAAEVELHVVDLDVSHLPGEKLKELSGSVTATANAAGNLSDIEGALVRADVSGLKLNWRNHAISNDKPIQLGYGNHELTIVEAEIRMDHSTVQFAGNVPLEGSAGQLQVKGRADLDDLTNLISLDSPVRAEGELLLDGSLRGNLKKIYPDLTFTLTDATVESEALVAPLRETNLKAVARDGRLVLEQFTGTWGGAKVSAQGEATFALLPDLPIEIPRPESPIRLTANVEQFKLSSMTQPPPNTDGTISLRIEAQAEKPDISAVQLRVAFPDLRFNSGAFSLDQMGESRIEIQNGVASVRQFHLTGPQTNIQLSGTADLRNSGPVNVQLKGDTDVAVLALFSKAAKGTGAAQMNVAVTGTVKEPKVNGYVEIRDGQAQINSPRMAAENLQVRLDLNGEKIDLTRLDGTLNGGTIKGDGQITISGPLRGETKLAISGDGVYMELPRGLKTVSNAQFRVDGTYPAMVITGKVDVEEGSYTEPLRVGRGLMKYFSNEPKLVVGTEQPADLKDTRLDIAVRTLSPIEVNNNIAQGEIDAELRLLGTIEEPGLTGKIEVDEGAWLYLRERKYSIDRGLITFNNEHTIEPILDVSATTTVKTNASGTSNPSEYDITMKISGNVSRKLDTDLTSIPPLAEEDVLSVLATGRTKKEASSEGGAVAKEQMLSFIAGDLGSSFTSEAGRAIGLSQVRIDPGSIGSTKSSDSTANSDPNLVSKEAEPTARLTLGKDITPDLSLVYSMNLRDSSDQIWIAEYDITRRVSTSGIVQSDNTFRLQVEHDLLLGLSGVAAKSSTPAKRKIGAIQFAGDSHHTAETLLSSAGLKAGKSYDFFSVQNARERLEKLHYGDGRLEARITVEKKTIGSTVDLVFHIKEGPQVQLVFEGWDKSDDLKDEIRKAWSEGVIDIQRIADAEDIIESALIKERYSDFHVESVVEVPTEVAKTVVFKIQPGLQYDELRVAFEGVHAIKESELQALLKAVGYFKQGPREREQAVPAIESIYSERGYIDVKVEPPVGQLNEQSRTLTSVFQVAEGGLYHFGDVRFQGNAEFTNEALSTKIKIGPETVFQLVTANKARQTLQELYRHTGYNDSTVQFSQVKDVSRKIVSLTFDIHEGSQRIVQEIQIDGNEKTTKGLIHSQLALAQGDILSDEKLSRARTNLYDIGAYAFVDFDVVPLEHLSGFKANQMPVRVIARVREVQPWEVKYGGYYDTERGFGVITDFSNRNMLGAARVVGMQVRYDGQLREGRAYFSQPVSLRFPIKTLFSAFKSHEEKTDKSTDRTTITDKKGLSPTVEYEFRKVNTFSLGYRLEKTHQFTAEPDPLFPDALVQTAPLTTSFTRDTRDDPFDASYGHFTSHAMDWGLGALKSDLHYLKYFGQYFDYVRLSKPTVVPWSHEVRNRLLLAFGARVGLLKGERGQDFRTEQFKSGGGTTVRGFQQDHLGPLDAAGNPKGGDAELILNSELRFPLYKFFDGVGFIDAGNVYPRLQDFSPFDLRASYGFGVRIRTPYLLLRFDYGLNMKPKPGEPKGQFFFTFGQAF